MKLQDPRLIDHGERVAYIALRICEETFSPAEVDTKSLITLCLFHDVGAYKTEEISRMTEFETVRVYDHSVYGYLFLKHFSPLGDMSEAVLYHHLNYPALDKLDFKYKTYSALIHLADRIDIAMKSGLCAQEICQRIDGDIFAPLPTAAAKRLLLEDDLLSELHSGGFRERIASEIRKLDLPFEEAVQYLKMLVYTIDFKSTYTVDHSLNTSEISLFLGEKSGLGTIALEKLYFAGLIHDIGKIAIPTDILENPGRLSPMQMVIMETHVSHTEEILTGIIAEDVLQIAVRHHEKLDGSGYPHGLRAELLCLSDRIIAVADIFSALVSKRSYKDSFSKEKTDQILQDMAGRGQLDPDVVALAVRHSDEILSMLDEKSRPLKETYRLIMEQSQQEHDRLMKLDQ